MDDPVAFLRARLDEDEAAAKGATAGPWERGRMRNSVVLAGDRVGHEDDYRGIAHLAMTQGNFQAEARNAQHIARHDPARVLREVEAKRRILDRYEDALARLNDPNESNAAARAQVQEYQDWILPRLTQSYGDLPDYKQDLT